MFHACGILALAAAPPSAPVPAAVAAAPPPAPTPPLQLPPLIHRCHLPSLQDRVFPHGEFDGFIAAVERLSGTNALKHHMHDTRMRLLTVLSLQLLRCARCAVRAVCAVCGVQCGALAGWLWPCRLASLVRACSRRTVLLPLPLPVCFLITRLPACLPGTRRLILQEVQDIADPPHVELDAEADPQQQQQQQQQQGGGGSAAAAAVAAAAEEDEFEGMELELEHPGGWAGGWAGDALRACM